MNAHIITIAQQKGGAGKTTLAAHLAVAFDTFGLSVCVIDTDPQGSLAMWYAEREQKLGKENAIALVEASGWRVGSAIDRIKHDYDVILIDSPPRTETEARTSIRHADLVVVPLQPSPMDLWATKATLAIAAEDKVPTLIVLNRVNNNTTLAQTIRSKLKALSKNEIGNRVIYAATLMDGLGVSEVAPYSVAGEEIEALAEEILAKFGIDLVSEELQQCVNE